MSGTPVSGDYIKAEGKAGRIGARLMAIVAEGDRGRFFLAPTPEHEAAALEAKPEWRPDGVIATRMTGGDLARRMGLRPGATSSPLDSSWR